jgi:hypothetical protein
MGQDLAAQRIEYRLDFPAGVATGNDWLFHETILPCDWHTRGCFRPAALVTNVKGGDERPASVRVNAKEAVCLRNPLNRECGSNGNEEDILGHSSD